MVRSEDLQQSEQLGEVLDRSAEEGRAGYAVSISSAEMDHAVSIAHRYPRNITRFLRDSLSMATSSEETAKECMYALPRKEWDKETRKEVIKIVEGPSVRLAEIMLSAWGNVKVGSRIVETGNEMVVAEGVFIDLEKNVHISRHISRGIVGSTGKRFGAEMIKTTSNAASSIAMRNAITVGIPRALWSKVLAEVKRVIAGDAKTVDQRRKEVLKQLNIMGVANDRIFALLTAECGRPIEGIMDIGLDEIVKLNGLGQAIHDQEISAEEAFPPIVRTRVADEKPAPAKADDKKAPQQPSESEKAQGRAALAEGRTESIRQEIEKTRAASAEQRQEQSAGKLDDEFEIKKPATEGGITADEIQRAIAKATTNDELTTIVIPMISEIDGEENRKSLHMLALRKAASFITGAQPAADAPAEPAKNGRPKEMQ